VASDALVTYDPVGAVATITIDRAERLNTINESVLTAALSCLERAASAEEVRVVILTGKGRAFSVGGDLSSGAGGGIAADLSFQQPDER